MKKGMFVAAIAAGSFIASAATADFTGWSVENYSVSNGAGDFCIIDLYADFESQSDTLLSVLNMNIQLNGADCFYNASAPPFLPASLAPVAFGSALPSDEWIADSFVTIGVDQEAASNGWSADPNFEDNCTNVGVDGGWFNVPPTNGQGIPGSDLRVLVGRFTVLAAEADAGASLSISGSAAFNDGSNAFSDLGTIAWIPAPGAIAMLGMAGLVGTRRRRG